MTDGMEGDMSISVDDDASRGGFDGTPLATSPRVVAAQQRALDATSAVEVAERVSRLVEVHLHYSQLSFSCVNKALHVWPAKHQTFISYCCGLVVLSRDAVAVLKGRFFHVCMLCCA